MRVLATLFVAQRCYSTFLRAGQSLDDSHMRPRPSHPPFADGLAHGLGGFGADCWQEANEILRPAILCPSRLKGVPKEIERDVLESPGPAVFLAVHNPGLLRVKIQTALLEPTPDGLQHLAGLLLALAVDDGIIRIPLELDVREDPSPPMVERVVQE